MQVLFKDIQKLKRQKPSNCDDLEKQHKNHLLMSDVDNSKTIKILSPQEIDNWKIYTKYPKKLKLGCRLRSKTYFLNELLPRSAFFEKNGRTHARLFHGTKSNHLFSILKQNLRIYGGGTLGKGFYVTPSLEKALIYTSKIQQQKETFPIILTLEVPDPHLLRVCCIDRLNESSCCENADVYTDYDELWQFIIKDQNILDLIQFEVWIV